MPMSVIKKEIETEKLIGYRYVQTLCRAESLVNGAGREAVVPLLYDASAAVISTDIQNDRLIINATLHCQAVYRQGEESTLRALSAKTSVAQAIDIQDAQPGMLSRVEMQVEHVDARYENGHMHFQAAVGIRAWLMTLEKVEAISDITEKDSIEMKYEEAEFVKLAAEADETAVMTAEIDLPHSLDARNTLMDWGCVLVDSVQADLGGIRVKGRAMIETLVSSGIEGRPAVVVKYPIEFDKLIELPEWLRENAVVRAQVRGIRTQIDHDDDAEEGKLHIQADIHFSIAANIREKVVLLADAYGSGSDRIEASCREICACSEAQSTQAVETLRGTVITEDGSAAIGSIIAVRVQPNIAEISSDAGIGKISGIMEADVLYMPAGGLLPASTRAELPFELEIAQPLQEDSLVRLNVVSAEANALMSDRIEMKVLLCAECETRRTKTYSIITGIDSMPQEKRKPGYVICWPGNKDDAWSIGKRYGIKEADINAAAGQEGISAGKYLVLNV